MSLCVHRRLPALLAGLLLHSATAVADVAVSDALELQGAVQIALRNRAELSAASARADALAQRPAIVGALEDPMVSPSVDHYPFDMPEEAGGMEESGAGRRYDWSVSVEQRFPLSGVRGHRKDAASAEAQRAQALAASAGL